MKYLKFVFVAVPILFLFTMLAITAQTTEAVITVEAFSPQELIDMGWTTHPSTGLKVVGMEELVYLSAKEAGGEEITGVTWSLTTLPMGSTATLDSTNTVTTTFTPDTTGQYVVQVDITTASGTATASVTITVAKYVGVGTVGDMTPNTANGQCGLCHSGNEATWANTGHAGIFKEGIEGILSDHYSESCIECHTVGYYEGANNGGFWDVQQQTGWTFPDTLVPQNWDDLVDNYPTLAAVSNIQCENCHGPGSMHKGDKSKIDLTLDEGLCGRCHDEGPRHIKSTQWKLSAHATGTSFARGTSATCAPCHSGWGFVAKMDPASNLDQTTGNQNVSCAVCHDPHDASKENQLRLSEDVTLSNDEVISKGGEGLLCMNCHHGREDAVEYAQEYHSHFGPHHSNQADMLFGTNAITWGRHLPNSTHKDALADACVSCHMFVTPAEGVAGHNAVGEHTFAVRTVDDNGTPNDPSDDTEVDNVAACARCHGEGLTSFHDIMAREDYDGDGSIESAMDEFDGLVEEVGMLLPPLGSPDVEVTEEYSKLQLNAAFNYLFATEDRSHGVHNFQYVINLLKLTKSALNYGVLVAGDIVSISDVPNDQGKQVRVVWTRFGGDGVSNNPVENYAIWRLVETPENSTEKTGAALTDLNISAAEIAEFEVGTRLQIAQELWDFVGSVPAAALEQYSAIAPTLYDSTAADGVHLSTFMVSGHTQITTVYAATDPATGYSIDNLSPVAPTNFSGKETVAGVALTWDDAVDEDFKYFAVYRSTTPGFDPGTMEPLSTVTEANYTDSDVTIGTTYYYRLSAFDFAGNESAFSNELSLLVTSIDGGPGIPESYALEQNYPNPFNPTTTIKFGLKESGHVTMTIYNALGEKVMTVIDDEMQAGNHQVSLSAEQLSSGIYFYQIRVNNFASVKKMIVMK